MKALLFLLVVFVLSSISPMFVCLAESELSPDLVSRSSKNNLWTEKQLREYLKLPVNEKELFQECIDREELRQIVLGLDSKTVADCRIRCLLDKYTRPQRLGHPEPVIKLVVELPNERSYHVAIYDSGQWNRWCEKLFRFIARTSAYWHDIPHIFNHMDDGNVYSLKRCDFSCAGASFFVRNGWYAIHLGHVNCEEASSEVVRKDMELLQTLAEALIDYIAHQRKSLQSHITTAASVTNSPLPVVVQPQTKP